MSCLWTYIHPMPDMHIHQYLFETPIDESHTSLYLVNVRNFLLDEDGDERMTTRNEAVAVQDRDVLLDVHPVQTPEDQTREFFVPSDGAVGAYRERLKEWEARGWRIDCAEVARNRLKVAYAIPSPDRRNEKGWILDAIPLLPGDPAALAAMTRGAKAEA